MIHDSLSVQRDAFLLGIGMAIMLENAPECQTRLLRGRTAARRGETSPEM
jgi:hypothetical protein